MSGTLQQWVEDMAAKRGTITPDQLVIAAQNPKSPGHSYFEWDDSSAAHRWRLEQAARLIRRCRVEYRPASAPDELRKVRAFWPTETPAGTVYAPTDAIGADPVASSVMLAEMEREWRAFRRRWEHMAEFIEMISADIAA